MIRVENWTGGRSVGFIPRTIFYRDETANLKAIKGVIFFMDWADGILSGFFSRRERYRYSPDLPGFYASQDYDRRLRMTHILFPKRTNSDTPLSWKQIVTEMKKRAQEGEVAV